MTARLRQLVCLLALVPLSGCATLFSSGSQRMQFTSSPEGAEVMVDGVPVGVTPIVVNVDRKLGERYVTIRKPGYQTKQFRLAKTLNTAAIFNLSSVLSWATDATTGALIEYAPNAYYVDLGAGPVGPPGASRKKARALRFVLVSRRHILTDIARRRGEYLRALAGVFAVPERAYSQFVELLASQAPRLAALEERPHALYQAMLSMLRDRGLVGWEA